MIRKTMRVGEIRTSIKLEEQFWGYLREVADDRRFRLSGLVNEIAEATPDRTNLASTLRTYALTHARMRAQSLKRELDKLALAGNTSDLERVLESSPLPALILSHDRSIRLLNRSFVLWLNLDRNATLGNRIDNIMILRGPNLKDMWSSLLDGRMARAGFSATYVSPGKVRTAQAMAIALSANSATAAPGSEPRGAGPRPAGAEGVTDPSAGRGCVVLFETLAGRS